MIFYTEIWVEKTEKWEIIDVIVDEWWWDMTEVKNGEGISLIEFWWDMIEVINARKVVIRRSKIWRETFDGIV